MAFGIDPSRLAVTPQDVLARLARKRAAAQQERQFQQQLVFERESREAQERQYQQELQFKRESAEQQESLARSQLAEQRAIARYGEREEMKRLKVTEHGRTERERMGEAGALERTGITQVGAMGRAGLAEAGRVERAGVTARGKTAKEQKADIEKQRKWMNDLREDYTGVTRKRTHKDQIEMTNPYTGEVFYGMPRTKAPKVSAPQQKTDKNFIIALDRGIGEVERAKTEDDVYETAIEEGINLSNPAVDKAIQKWVSKKQKQQQEEQRKKLGKPRGWVARKLGWGYSQTQEQDIYDNMRKHGKTRSEVIAALKKKGYL